MISLVSRSFANYFNLLDTWAAWASDELENWDEGTDLTPALAASVRETLAEIAALRPATSLAAPRRRKREPRCGPSCFKTSTIGQVCP